MPCLKNRNILNAFCLTAILVSAPFIGGCNKKEPVQPTVVELENQQEQRTEILETLRAMPPSERIQYIESNKEAVDLLASDAEYRVELMTLMKEAKETQ